LLKQSTARVSFHKCIPFGLQRNSYTSSQASLIPDCELTNAPEGVRRLPRRAAPVLGWGTARTIWSSPVLRNHNAKVTEGWVRARRGPGSGTVRKESPAPVSGGGIAWAGHGQRETLTPWAAEQTLASPFAWGSCFRSHPDDAPGDRSPQYRSLIAAGGNTVAQAPK